MDNDGYISNGELFQVNFLIITIAFVCFLIYGPNEQVFAITKKEINKLRNLLALAKTTAFYYQSYILSCRNIK